MAEVHTKQITGLRNKTSSDKELEDFLYQVTSRGGRIVEIETEYFEYNKYVDRLTVGEKNNKNNAWIQFTVYYTLC